MLPDRYGGRPVQARGAIVSALAFDHASDPSWFCTALMKLCIVFVVIRDKRDRATVNQFANC